MWAWQMSFSQCGCNHTKHAGIPAQSARNPKGKRHAAHPHPDGTLSRPAIRSSPASRGHGRFRAPAAATLRGGGALGQLISPA